MSVRTLGRGPRFCLLVALIVGAGAASAAPASATTHGYCNWDGSNQNSLAPYALCPQSGSNYLTDNSAAFPGGETDSGIYCGAALNGVQYGSNATGVSSCSHAYGGTNLLTAYLFVGPTSHTVHGQITY